MVRLNGSIAEIFKNWLEQAYPDKVGKVLNQIAEMHGGSLNDSQWQRRMSGEGPVAAVIKRLCRISKDKYLQDHSLATTNTELFRLCGRYYRS